MDKIHVFMKYEYYHDNESAVIKNLLELIHFPNKYLLVSVRHVWWGADTPTGHDQSQNDAYVWPVTDSVIFLFLSNYIKLTWKAEKISAQSQLLYRLWPHPSFYLTTIKLFDWCIRYLFKVTNSMRPPPPPPKPNVNFETEYSNFHVNLTYTVLKVKHKKILGVNHFWTIDTILSQREHWKLPSAKPNIGNQWPSSTTIINIKIELVLCIR